MIMGGRVSSFQFQVGFAEFDPNGPTAKKRTSPTSNTSESMRFGIASLQHVRGGLHSVLVIKFSEGFSGKVVLF